MTSRDADADTRDRGVVDAERALLARVRRALEAAASRRAPERDARATRDALRLLRDEAMHASEDDLPGLLHELDVQKALAGRARTDVLPDPARPYFAHLRVLEGGRAKDYCLGEVTFVDAAADVRVLDWRTAPMARVFYAYREGDDYEEPVGPRVAEGTVLARRLVAIADGELESVDGDGFTLARRADGTYTRATHGALASLAEAGDDARIGVGVGASERAALAITARLDAAQYAAISAPAETPLLVLGRAGSGKTTVALHRLARLLAHEGETPARVTVVVPEEGLARLTRRLLEPLGVDPGCTHTLDAFFEAHAQATFARPVRVCPDTPAEAIGLKRSPFFYRALVARLEHEPPKSTRLRDLREALADALTDRAFLGAVVDASAGALTRGTIEVVVRHTMAQLAEPVRALLATITDPAMKQAVDGLDVAEGTPDAVAGTLDAEDLPILLAMRAARGALGGDPITHLVLDEAEDFSLFELDVLRVLRDPAGSLTLAGDEAQVTTSCFASWDEALAVLGARDATTCRLTIGYRCPRPVTTFASKLLADDAPLEAAREGAPVWLRAFPERAQALVFLRDALADLDAREPHARVAVIAHDAGAAREVHGFVSATVPARLVLDGAFTFDPGIDVTHVDAVKGLEFDYVLVPDATRDAYPDTPEARRRLHVAVTRTSHQLVVLAGGAPSPLIVG